MAFKKRKIYLINPKFQIKFSLMVCFLLFVSSLIYPMTIYDLLSSFIEQSSVTSPELAENMSSKKNSLLWILAIWQVGFLFLVGILCIFFSHKIAGPIYKTKQFLQKVRGGELAGKVQFRNGDYFHDLADEINETFETIQENYRKDFVYLSEVNSYISNLSLVVPEDKKVVLNEISKRLAEIQSQYSEV